MSATKLKTDVPVNMNLQETFNKRDKEFDKRILGFRKKVKEYPSDAINLIAPLIENDHDGLRNFITQDRIATIEAIEEMVEERVKNHPEFDFDAHHEDVVEFERGKSWGRLEAHAKLLTSLKETKDTIIK